MAFPYSGSLWKGPNSNTFTEKVLLVSLRILVQVKQAGCLNQQNIFLHQKDSISAGLCLKQAFHWFTKINVLAFNKTKNLTHPLIPTPRALK